MMYTEEQQLAIDARGKNILVSAAAGSGKTAVLVERIIKMIMDPQKPVDIDRLLVVTFTELAATEMKQRIEKKINEKIKEFPQDENLAKQLSLLNKSNITTIHAFCNKIIRNYFHYIDLDPGYKIGDEAELQLLRRDILTGLLETYYEKEDVHFLSLVESYGKRYHDIAFQELVLNVYDFVNAGPWPEQWLQDQVDQFICAEGIDGTRWIKWLTQIWAMELEMEKKNLNNGIRIASLANGPYKYVATLEDDLSLINQLSDALQNGAASFQKSLNQVLLSFQRLPAIRKTDPVEPSLKEMVAQIRKSVQGRLKQLKENIFYKPMASLEEDVQQLYPLMHVLAKIVMDFRIEYSLVKREKNVLDYSDLEHFALAILLKRDSETGVLEPSMAALDLRNKFQEVFIDEYQDSNEIQELILSTIANNDPPNWFMVGDIKQSIYKFRLARPEIFIHKLETFPGDPSGLSSDNLRINLAKNFRSRPCVLSAVNYLFSQLMNRETMEIDYNEDAALYPGFPFPETELPVAASVDIHVLETGQLTGNEGEDITAVEHEARYIAERILNLVNGEDKLHVWDKDISAYRPARYEDIVILLRSVGREGEVFENVFKGYGIPLQIGKKGGFYETLEVTTVLSFLQIIDNPLQDIPLLSILRSPIYEFTNDELVEIRGVNHGAYFYECCIHYKENGQWVGLVEKISCFLDELNDWRKRSIFMPISQLIQELYDNTGYYTLAGLLPNGAHRQNNLKLLLDKAVQYEKTSLKGLFHFNRYIERMRLLSSQTDEGTITTTEMNSVRIMTIHKSKGLEFPVVFVSRLGKKINKEMQKEDVSLHYDMGFGPVYYDLPHLVKYNTVPRYALYKKLAYENTAEELRVLYVALTRAKEKLILTGTVNQLEKRWTNWAQFISYPEMNIPGIYLATAGSFIDMIMSAICRHPEGIRVLGENGMDISAPMAEQPVKNVDFKLFIQLKPEEKMDMNLFNEDGERDGENPAQNEEIHLVEKEIGEKFSWKYPFQNALVTPSKISISELKRLFYLEMEKDSTPLPVDKEIPSMVHLEKPLFLREKTAATSAQKGTAIHAVLEHIEVRQQYDENKINNLINELILCNILTEDVKEYIQVQTIMRFLSSPLAVRMRKSEYLKKEVSFVLGLTPKEVFYPEEKNDNYVLVHGIIDCYFKEADGIVLVDYKSGWQMGNNTERQLAEKYGIQLSIYQKAIEKETGEKVKEKLLYGMEKGNVVVLP